MLRVLGFQVSAQGKAPVGGSLLVANHVGFWDVLVLSSLCRCVFVTSMEVKNTPVLGAICKLAGCLFVERRSLVSISSDCSQIAQALSCGLTVVVFAEGTSSDGKGILPLKRGLIAPLAHQHAVVTPAVISYDRINQAPITRERADQIFYYGDQAFVPQFKGTTAQQSIEVSVHFLDALPCPTQKPDMTRLHQRMLDVYQFKNPLTQS